ncbi:MAG: methyltransferase domain-containing protein [bacterium]|nr:methyltransferase domain-containing protein [bacterium]
MTYAIQRWIDDKEVRTHSFSGYWNNPEFEKDKLWSLCASDFGELEKRFAKKKLVDQFEMLAKAGMGKLSGMVGASLASGTCLLEAMVLKKYPGIRQLSCVEFSRHRITIMAPPTLAHYRIPPEQVQLCFGSFYDLKIPDQSLDFVLLSQAFHHADDPVRLLKEVKRVLKADGLVYIIGEHYFTRSEFLVRVAKHFVKFFLNYKRYRKARSFIPRFHVIIPNDPQKGDHHYTRKEYRAIFENMGFAWQPFVFQSIKKQGFLLRRQSS